MSEAVFISYASEDVEAAERVALALKEAGVEVWFDKSELRGGDAWDQNIRKRIHDCALFIPVISATTERRHEGYFRLEWRLADRRTHHMGRSRAFLVPVCIDPVDEDQADVPDSFWEVQWVSAPQGAVPAGFGDTIRGLLAGAPDGQRVGGSVVGRGGKKERHQWTATEFRWMFGLGALVALLAVGVANLGEIRTALGFEEAAVALEKSIAVLPFDDLSLNATGTAFADGVQEEIRSKLEKVRELTVKPRTTVLQYRNAGKSMSDIAKELDVNYILTGTVTRDGDSVRVTAGLYEARTEKLLRPFGPYLQPMKDLFNLQALLAESIATELRTALSEQEKALLARKPTDNRSAYTLYTEVNTAFSLDRPTRAWLQVQEEKLQTVVGMDETFSQAWGQLAVVHSLQVSQGFDASDRRLAAAKDAIDRAVEIDAESPDVIRSLGIYYLAARRDYAKAIEQFEKLDKLQPNSGDPSGYLGAVQRRQGKWPEALVNLRKSTRLEPGNLNHARTLENVLIDGRLYESAIPNRAQLNRTILMNDRGSELILALLELRGRGQTTTGDALIKALGEVAETPVGLSMRLRWARATGDLDEAMRIDRLRPQLPDGEPEWAEALEAAATLGAKGDMSAAQARLNGIEQKLNVRLVEDQNNATLRSSSGLALALLGKKDEALAAGQRAVELAKLEDGVDAVAEATARLKLVLIRAWNGDKATAIAELDKLLESPGCEVTVFSMKLDPWFAPLRGDAAFEALLADPVNARPLIEDFGGRRGGPGGPGGPGGGRGGPGGAPGGGRGNRGQFPEGGAPRGGG